MRRISRVALTSTVVSLLLAAILYLSGSFAAASFNITAWDTMGRGIVAFVWLFGTVAVIGTVIQIESECP